MWGDCAAVRPRSPSVSGRSRSAVSRVVSWIPARDESASANARYGSPGSGRAPAPAAECAASTCSRVPASGPSPTQRSGSPRTPGTGSPGCRVSTLARGEVGGVQDAARERVGAVVAGDVDVGQLAGVRDVEVEGAEDVQIEVDGVGELDRAGVTEVEGARQVAGDGVGQGASAGEVEAPEQAGVGGAGVPDDVRPGEVEGVRVGQDDGVGVRVHELDPASLGASAGGQVAREGAAQGTDVVQVPGDIEGHVEDGGGEHLGQYRGVPDVARDGPADGGAGQRVRVRLAGTEPQSRWRLGPRGRHGGRELTGERAGDGLLLEFILAREPDLDAGGGGGDRVQPL